MGNTNMYSNFECDQCNDRFSGFEDDLAGFLGISRSVTGLSNEKKAPSFTGRRLRAKSRSFMGNNILILAPEDLEEKGGKTIIRYTKNPFRPAGVYKALLKSALSLIDESSVKNNYVYALALLAGKFSLTQGAAVAGYNFSYNINLPLHIYLFRKHNASAKIPTEVLMFCFQNNMLVLPIPFHQADLANMQADFDIIVPPPYFVNQDDLRSSNPRAFFRDFSTSEKIDNEDETFVLEFDPNHLEKLWSYDLTTDKYEQTPFSISNTKYLIIVRDGVVVNPKELSTFIRQEMAGNS